MELRAVIEALNSLKEPCHVTLYSDSQYMKMASHNGFTIGRKQLESESTGKAVKPRFMDCVRSGDSNS